MDERPNKLARISRLRNKLPYISQSALGSILKLAESEELPTACGRNIIRAARDAAVQRLTPFGAIHQKIKVDMKDGSQLDVEIQHPAALMHHLCKTSKSFSDLLSRSFSRKPASFSNPWNLIVYADEILPGNQLAYKHARKSWGIYWSLLEFGSAALSDEDNPEDPAPSHMFTQLLSERSAVALMTP